MTLTRAKALTLPVVEMFGPTVQGEGPQAGRPAYFVRLGGCDYRCSWCDSLYAVEPAQVREGASWMTAEDVRAALRELSEGPRLVVLTGGNPVLHQLGELVDVLHEDGFEVAVETQGSVYRSWIAAADQVVVSPKPPSSGEATEERRRQFTEFMRSALADRAALVLKIVVFDAADLEYARAVARSWPFVQLHLSVGTDPDPAATHDRDVELILDRYRWLCEAAAGAPELADARVTPQLHVLIWGRRRGV